MAANENKEQMKNGKTTAVGLWTFEKDDYKSLRKKKDQNITKLEGNRCLKENYNIKLR